jgi:putative flippase GtrA
MEMVHKLFFEKTDNSRIQFFRYFFVVGASFGTDFFILFTFTEFFSIHYMISSVVGYLAGMAINYLLSIKWVFKYRVHNSKTLEFSIFIGIGLLGMVINQGLMWFFTDILAIYFMLSRMISAVIGYLWKFFARKHLLFKKKRI